MTSLLSTLLVLSVAVYFASAMVIQRQDSKSIVGKSSLFGNEDSIFKNSFFKNDIFSKNAEPQTEISVKTSISNKLVSDKKCSTSQITRPNEKTVSNKTCKTTGYIKKAVNDDCTEYSYFKQTITSSSSPNTDVNNGVAKCTQKKCDSSDEPSTIDCLEAFGKADLFSLDNKQ